MMKRGIERLLGVVLVLAAAASCGNGQRAGESPKAGRKTTFSLPHVLNTDHPVHQALEKLAAEVATRSGGAMVIKIQPGGTLGTEQELCDNVSNDADAFTKISSTILETKSELAKIYSLPYLFRDSEHMWKVLEGPIGKELLDMAVEKNLKGICYFDAGARSFYTKQKVDSPEDLKGMKIRVQKSVMMQKLIETLGASPQQIAFSELYTALNTGVVQGAENNIPSYYTHRHYRVAPYFVFDEHVCLPDVLLMSAKRWNKLTPEQQKIIMNSAQVVVDFQRKLWEEKSKEYMTKMKTEGVTFTRLESKDDFVEATQPIYGEFEGTEVMKYVERIRAVE
jgi:tripartite ATP-independent transporter DctP family solute receptor